MHSYVPRVKCCFWSIELLLFIKNNYFYLFISRTCLNDVIHLLWVCWNSVGDTLNGNQNNLHFKPTKFNSRPNQGLWSDNDITTHEVATQPGFVSSRGHNAVGVRLYRARPRQRGPHSGDSRVSKHDSWLGFLWQRKRRGKYGGNHYLSAVKERWSRGLIKSLFYSPLKMGLGNT